MEIKVNLNENSYKIIIKDGLLDEINEYIHINNKALIVTDNNIPIKYIKKVSKVCIDCYSIIINSGEKNKSFANYQKIISYMLANNFSREDYIIALGGGVIGDLAGFVAATYKRGCNFINIPTTTLSMVDSSIGGKVAINYDGYKNVVGAFYQPNLVLIDTETLITLPKRHYYNGLVEALKAGLIYDASLFSLFKNRKYDAYLIDIIIKSLFVKKDVVEKDQYEKSLRKILNFGHTVGHAIESYFNFEELYHGEAVANGMLYMFDDEKLKEEVREILLNMNIPLKSGYDINKLFELIKNDKKANKTSISIVKVKRPGECYIEDIKIEKIIEILRR